MPRKNLNAFSIEIAGRYLRSRSPAFSNVGRLAFIGLVLSVSVLVVVISVVNGFERELRDRVLGLIPSMTVLFHNGMSAQEAQQLTQQDSPTLAGSPFLRGQVLLVQNGNIAGAELTGILPNRFKNVSQVFEYTKHKNPEILQAKQYGVILGAGLAARLNVAIGDDVRLVIPVASISAAGAMPRQRRMRVVDILNSQSLLDAQAAYVHLDIAKRLFRQSLAQGWQLRTADLFNLSAVTEHLYAAHGERIRVSAWMDRYGSLYQAIAVQKLTMFFLLLFLVAVAAFNLVSGLIMIVEQRKADVAVLATLGLTAPGIMLLFAGIGLGMALSGIGLGLFLGSVVAFVLPHLFAALSEMMAVELMTQYFINYLPSEVRVQDLVIIGSISFLLAAIASLFPAWRATRLSPAKVLNHE